MVTIVMNQDSTLLLLVYKHVRKRCSQFAKVLPSRDCKTKLTKKTQHYQDTARGMYQLDNDGHHDKAQPQRSSSADIVEETKESREL